jgi:alpha-mannosidase
VVLDETHCDTWAHNKETLGEVVGTFDSPEFKVTEEGNVRVTLRVITHLNGSTLQREYSLTPDSDVLTVKTRVEVREKHRCLKFNFPISGEKITSKVPYGTFDRPLYTGEEPCGSWFTDGTLCVANDCKYAYDTKDDEVRMSILRTAIYADHFGIRDYLCEHMDMDVHEFNYSLYPFTDNATAERKAELLNFGLVTSLDTFHDGKLAEDYCGFECENSDVIFTAIKKSQDMENTVIRLYEANNNNSNVEFKLFGDKVSFDISHNQVKTFNEKGDELNMLEWKK